MFSDPDNPTDGVSAVKALGIGLSLNDIVNYCSNDKLGQAISAYLIIFSFAVFVGVIVAGFLGTLFTDIGGLLIAWSIGLLIGALLESLLSGPAIRNICRD
jgi:purine-cytosine permease-like protein